MNEVYLHWHSEIYIYKILRINLTINLKSAFFPQTHYDTYIVKTGHYDTYIDKTAHFDTYIVRIAHYDIHIVKTAHSETHIVKITHFDTHIVKIAVNASIGCCFL